MKQPLWERIATHAVLLIASAIALFPLIWIVSASFKNQFDVLSTEIEIIPSEPTLENYEALFNPASATGGYFWNWFGNSVFIAVMTTILSVFLAATAAYALSRYRFHGKRPATTFFLVSQMFPAVILLVPLFQLLGIQLRLLNTPWALILAYATTAVPFCVLMLKSYFDTLPIELEEAARIDGCSQLEAFWRILLPLSVPALVVVFLFNFLTAWNDYFLARILLSKEELLTWPLGLQRFQQQFQTQWNELAAASILISIPVVLLFLYSSKWLVSGVTAGGVKG